MDYPKVNPKICTGCGICVDTCAFEAIVLDNDIAKIINDKCNNCRACESECPLEAIS